MARQCIHWSSHVCSRTDLISLVDVFFFFSRIIFRFDYNNIYNMMRLSFSSPLAAGGLCGRVVLDQDDACVGETGGSRAGVITQTFTVALSVRIRKIIDAPALETGWLGPSALEYITITALRVLCSRGLWVKRHRRLEISLELIPGHRLSGKFRHSDS